MPEICYMMCQFYLLVTKFSEKGNKTICQQNTKSTKSNSNHNILLTSNFIKTTISNINAIGRSRPLKAWNECIKSGI